VVEGDGGGGRGEEGFVLGADGGDEEVDSCHLDDFLG
jgi:hypothetical protein